MPQLAVLQTLPSCLWRLLRHHKTASPDASSHTEPCSSVTASTLDSTAEILLLFNIQELSGSPPELPADSEDELLLQRLRRGSVTGAATDIAEAAAAALAEQPAVAMAAASEAAAAASAGAPAASSEHLSVSGDAAAAAATPELDQMPGGNGAAQAAAALADDEPPAAQLVGELAASAATEDASAIESVAAFVDAGSDSEAAAVTLYAVDAAAPAEERRAAATAAGGELAAVPMAAGANAGVADSPADGGNPAGSSAARPQGEQAAPDSLGGGGQPDGRAPATAPGGPSASCPEASAAAQPPEHSPAPSGGQQRRSRHGSGGNGDEVPKATPGDTDPASATEQSSQDEAGHALPVLPGAEPPPSQPQRPAPQPDDRSPPSGSPGPASPAAGVAAQQRPAAAASAPRAAVTAMPPQHHKSTAAVMTDGTVQWLLSKTALHALHLPAAAVRRWNITAKETPCRLNLPGGAQHERKLFLQTKSSARVEWWGPVAAELSLQPGDLMQMRATRLSPLELHVHLVRGGKAAAAADSDGDAAAGDASAAADGKPARAAEAAAAAAAMPPPLRKRQRPAAAHSPDDEQQPPNKRQRRTKADADAEEQVDCASTCWMYMPPST